jgi:hypothetical protein
MFHLSDGKAKDFIQNGYNTPLCTAIDVSIRDKNYQGKTAYFTFTIYQNGNLHLEFTRPDLVKKINHAANVGSMELP